MSNESQMGATVEPEKPSSLQEIRRKAREVDDRLSVILEIVRGTLEAILGPVPTEETGEDLAKPNGLLEDIHLLLNRNIKSLDFLEKQVKKIKEEIG